MDEGIDEGFAAPAMENNAMCVGNRSLYLRMGLETIDFEVRRGKKVNFRQFEYFP